MSSKLVEAAARAVANYLTVGWDGIHKNKAHWRETYGMLDGIYGDVNGPFQDDCREAAKAAILAYLSALAEDETSVEAVAKIICVEEYGDPDGFGAITLGNVERTTPRWKYCEGSARAVLDALLSRAKEQQA